LAAFAKVLDPVTVTDRIVPFVVKASQDLTWNVRKILADTLSSFSGNTTSKVREEVFVDICDKLLADNSQWVANSMKESLGSFMASFSQNEYVRDYNFPNKDS
jgi:hypothetical protein